MARLPKRTIKLRHADAQGREFIRVSPKNKTDWASCHFSESMKITKTPFGQHGRAFVLNQFETNIFLTGFVALPLIVYAAVSVPVTAVYALAPFQLASTATLTQAAIAASPGLANIAGLMAGTEIASIWLSPDVKTPEFANFNKPCGHEDDPITGQF